MGYALAYGRCIACGNLFGFNPLRVPSSTAITGTREPVCEPCFVRINERRKTMGLEPFPLMPGAYEPCDERDLEEAQRGEF